MKIEWRTELETGNAEIDGQHKELVRRFNNLLASCNQGKGREEVYNTLLFLGDYVRSHFRAEEELQRQHGYPGYPAHKEQHEKFVDDLRKLESTLGEEGATIALVIQTNQTIGSWLIRHISATDREFAAYLRTQG